MKKKNSELNLGSCYTIGTKAQEAVQFIDFCFVHSLMSSTKEIISELHVQVCTVLKLIIKM